LDDRALLTEWKPAYKRGFAMQAPLAILGCLLGLIAWWQSGQWLWIIGALLMIAIWPWSILAMMPTNNKLTAIDPKDAVVVQARTKPSYCHSIPDLPCPRTLIMR
jgi:Domain of unknown function (DUF1772)